ncbi:MAG TPA: lytic transglycosylase domain-containing protein [Chthonomonadales bacterium]|nr:lytic transglycosylase domain-containing protein [Chthonomonadales bacterium]
MSIESMIARIEEIEARIRALSPEPPTLPLPDSRSLLKAAGSISSSGETSALPFNVSLAQATGQAFLRPVGKRFPPEIEALIQKYSDMNGLAPDLVRAVIQVESDGNPRAVSHKGALGLMQLMPEEVKGYGIRDPFDPEQNIAAGTRQLAEKLKLFNGDVALALAAYNAGTGAVRKYGGIPPYRETQNYVQRVLGLLGRSR